MQLHNTGSDSSVLKVQRYCLKNILAEFIPSLRLREDAMAKRTSTIAAFLSVANLED
jgi:hypothetical protein